MIKNIPNKYTGKLLRDKINKKFVDKYDLTIHIIKFHQAIRKLMCEECDKMILDKAAFIIHIEAVHLGIRKFKCDKHTLEVFI